MHQYFHLLLKQHPLISERHYQTAGICSHSDTEASGLSFCAGQTRSFTPDLINDFLYQSGFVHSGIVMLKQKTVPPCCHKIASHTILQNAIVQRTSKIDFTGITALVIPVTQKGVLHAFGHVVCLSTFYPDGGGADLLGRKYVVSHELSDAVKDRLTSG